MRSFGAENLPEILRWALHRDLFHWRVVRNVIHCPWPEALKATLVVDRVAKHLCVVDHRSYDAAICRFGERVRPVIDFFFQAEDGIRDLTVTGVQTCALPI